MLNLDFDVKHTKIYQEAIAEGEQIGIQKGEQIGIQIGIQKGEQIGIQKGEQIGIQKGEQIGIQKGEQIGIPKGRAEERKKMAQHIIEVLTAKFGPLPDIWLETIQNATSDQLLDLYGKAMIGERLEEVVS